MDLDLPTPVSRPPSLESGISICPPMPPKVAKVAIHHLKVSYKVVKVHHLKVSYRVVKVHHLKVSYRVVKVVLAPPWRHYLMPDPREGGWDTGVGRSSSI